MDYFDETWSPNEEVRIFIFSIIQKLNDIRFITSGLLTFNKMSTLSYKF